VQEKLVRLADIVANRLGADLFCTGMTGPGRNVEVMVGGNVNAWLNDTVQACEIGKRPGQKLIIIGALTGGTAVF
jgi:hypothetical protein